MSDFSVNLERLQRLTPQRLWFLSIFFSIAVTELIVSCMERILLGKISYDYLVTGFVASLFVAGGVAAALIILLRQLRLEVQCSHELAKELSKSEERRKLAERANHQFLWDYEVGTGNVYVSEGWSQLLGDAQETTHTTIHNLVQRLPEDDRPRFRDAIQNALMGQNTSACSITHRIRKFNGNFIWLRSEGQVIERDHDGQALRMIVSSRDITERKGIEDFMTNIRLEMERQHELQVAVQTAAAIAHELNQPLTAVNGYCSAAINMLGELPHTAHDQLCKTLKLALHQADRAGKVVHELLGFLQRDKSRSEMINLNDAVLEALDIVRAAGYSNFLSCLDLSQDMKPVQANRMHVRTVITNLVRNSAEAMGHAGEQANQQCVTIRTAVAAGMALVTIQDNGPGLSKNAATHVFEPFFTTKPNGIGMGLTTSRSLIESSGGRLWFDSEPRNGGTAFHFTLPFVK